MWNETQHQSEDLLERNKRYGRVYEVFHKKDIFVVRVHLPRQTPNHPWIFKYGLSKQLKPYQIQAQINQGQLQIQGWMQDAELKVFCGLINSFPDGFEILMDLDFKDKYLEIEKVDDYTVDIQVFK